jgi:hypothetical protein
MEAHLLDAAAWAKFSELLRTPGLIEQELDRMRASETPGADVFASIDKLIAGLTAQIARKRRLFELTDDEQTQRELADEINQLAALRRKHEAERANAELHYADWQQQQDGLQGTLALCERVGQQLDAMNYDEKRQALFAFKAVVRLWRADHLPHRAELQVSLPLSGTLLLELSTLAYCNEEATWSCHHKRAALRSQTGPPGDRAAGCS